MAKKKIMRKVLSCLFVIAILMSTVPGTVLAFEPIPTKIHLQDATFEWHTNQSLIAELVDEKNRSLSGKEVIFYANTTVGWHELGNIMTNESGIAKYDIFVTSPNGNYTFKAVFSGDQKYSGSSDITVITVEGNVAPLVVLGVVEAGVIAYQFFYPTLKRKYPANELIDSVYKGTHVIDLALLAAGVVISGHVVQVVPKALITSTVGGTNVPVLTGGIGGGAIILSSWAPDLALQAYMASKAKGELVSSFGEGFANAIGVTDESEKQELNKVLEMDAVRTMDSILSGNCEVGTVDPVRGYDKQLKVPSNVAKMRLYISWDLDICPSTLDFYELTDPDGKFIKKLAIFQEINAREYLGNNITVAEIEIDNPLPGDWSLWLDGYAMRNWNVGIMYGFDKYIEVVPKFDLVNPGKTTTYNVLVNNFKNTDATIDLSLRDVPAGWDVELSKTQVTLAPNTLDIIDLSVTPPETEGYGIKETIIVAAYFEGDGTSYSDNCTVWISPAEEIEEGIAWLHEHQKSDGSWNNNVGVTSLATLVYLNAGYDENVDDVQEGIDYILGYGHVHSDGSIYSDYDHRLYETSIAMLPLIATYNSSYNDIIADARDWLVKAQWDEDCLFGSVNKDNWYYGGFGYGRNIRPDLSNTQFALMAFDAADLPKNNPVWSKAQVFLERTQARDESNDQAWANGRKTGGFIYTPDGGTAGGGSIDGYGSMTGAGIWGLMLCGADQTDDRLKDALKWVKNNYYWDRNPGMSDPESGKYYYYLCMSKALAMAVGVEGKIDGHYWYDDMARNLISLQKSEGYWVNSNRWAWEYIPDLATSYSLLSLETRIIPSEISRLSYLTFILCSNADLHVYDPLGRHVGKNYATGGIDLEIPGATFDKNGIQKIHTPNLEAGDYKIKLVGTSSGGYDLNIIGGLGEKKLREESYSSTISKGEVHDASVNVAMLTGLTLHVTPPTQPQNQPPVNPTLTPDKPEPQNAGTTITWTASAIDPDGDPLYYRFWLKGPATGNSWQIMRDWSTDNTWTWYTSPADKGDIDISVWIRDGHHASASGYDIEKIVYDYQIGQEIGPCKLQITSNPSLQDRPSIVYLNGNYYVAYQSHEKGYGIYIKQFDSLWNFKKKVEVVSGSAYYDSPSLVYANNKLYAAYISNAKGASANDYDIIVKEYNPNSLSCTKGAKYLTSLQSCQDLPALLYKDGYFYLAYQSWETGNGDIYIKKFDSNWNPLKKVRVTTKSSLQDRPSLTYANGYFYVAYFSGETGYYDIFVKRLDPYLNLDSWKKQITSKSTYQSYPSLKYVNNEYAIAYASTETGTLGIYMKSYDSNWNFIEKTCVVGDSSAYERRPSMTYAQNNYWIAYVHNLVGSEDWNIFAITPGCEQPMG